MKVFLNFILLPLTLFILGITLGIIIRDFPLFSMNYNIKITEVIRLILMFGLGIFIPLIVKKIIDDKRVIKNNLIEEVNSFSKIANRINERLNTIYNSGKLTKADKDGFNLLFEISDDEFAELSNFIIDNCDSNSEKLIKELQQKQIEFWKTLTGSEVTKSNVRKINDKTYKEASKIFVEINAIIRRIKKSINQM